MSAFPVLPLKFAEDKERALSWEDVPTVKDLLVYIARMMGVDPNQLLQFQEIVYSSLAPTEQNKIWIKTDGAPGIGIYIGSGYKVIYEYPVRVPLIWTKPASDFPDYLTKLSDDQLTAYGLTAPTGDAFYFYLNV